MNKSKGYIYVFTAGALWGCIGLFVNFLGSMGAESGTTAFLRMFCGMCLMTILMLAKGGISLFKIDKKGLIICMMLGVFGQALFNYAYTTAIRIVGVATGSVLLYTAPVFVCIMSAVFFGENMTKVKVTALAVNIIGCILTVTGGALNAMEFSVIGVGVGIMAGFCYALTTIIGAVAKDYHSMTVTFYSFFFAMITLGVVLRPFGNLAECMSPLFIFTAFGYGLIPTVGSYILYMKGLSMDLETSKVPIVASVETVVAAIIGICMFREDFNPAKLIGITLVLFSIAIMNMGLGRQKSIEKTPS